MTKPPPAQPDSKDWTWVLDRPCEDCGADVGKLAIAQIARLNRDGARRWADLMNGAPEQLRARPEPDTWSPLEYACHVRDVYKLFLQRLELMLAQDNPMFENWDPNITADEDRYDVADPRTVAVEVLEAGDRLADAFDALTPDDLMRRGQRSDGAEFTLESFARYEIHDPEHHLWDVTGERSQACYMSAR